MNLYQSVCVGWWRFFVLKSRFENGEIMKSKKSTLSAIVFFPVMLALALVLPSVAFALQWGDFIYTVSDGTVINNRI